MKTNSKTQRAIKFFRCMESLGIDYSTAQRLRRIEMTLHRWHEAECGDSNDFASYGIERREDGKPVRVVIPHSGGKRIETLIPDRENGARRRLAAIMATIPHLWSYIQGDPRGCALYVGRKSDLKAGEQLNSVYTRGHAVCF